MLLIDELKNNKIIYILTLMFLYIYIKTTYELSNILSAINKSNLNIKIASYTLYSNIYNKEIIQYLILPFFLITISYNCVMYNKINLFLKFKSIQNWWNLKMNRIMLWSIICSLSLNIFIIIFIFLKGLISYLSIQFFVRLILCSVFQFLGLCTMALITELVVLKCNNNIYWGYVISLFIIYLIEAIVNTFKLNILTLPKYICFCIFYEEKLIGNINIFTLLLVILNTLLYFIGYFLLKYNDIYWRN